MKCFIHLKSPFNALYNTKEQSQNQNKNSNPESVPLNSISSVVPPLCDGTRSRFVEYLLQDHKSIIPVHKPFYLALFWPQNAAIYSFLIQVKILSKRRLVEPALGVFVA